MGSRRLSALNERLLRAGLAPRRVSRIIAELEDHLDDLLAELATRGLDAASALSEAHERLGSEDALFASVLARPELASWASRRPAVAFGLLPAPVFAVSFVAWIVVLVAFLNVAHLSLASSTAARSTGWWLSFAFQWALPAATAAVFSSWAWRRRVPWLWPTVGILITAIMGALTNSRAATTVAMALLGVSGCYLRRRSAAAIEHG
jgi:hypothetical protein